MASGWARSIGMAGLLAALSLAAPAVAQSLSETCRAPAPAPGQTVSGPVLHVIDGQTLCIAQGPTPDQWIPLRIAATAMTLPSDRERLMAAAFSQSLECKVTRGRGPVKTAACTLAGRPLDDLLQEPATITQAKAWR
jgi:CheY-like chemotaxis protein